MRYLRLFCITLAFAVACNAADSQAQLAWSKTDQSVALTNGSKVVWQFNHGEGHRKPCFHPLAKLDGTVLTEFRPSDHIWHRAAWFAIKNIDKLNYWEENREGVSAGRNDTLGVKIETNADFSAVIRLTQSYHPPEAAEVVGEERVVYVSAPQKDGSYTLDWHHVFTAQKDVSINAPARYAGLSIRVNRKFQDWSFLNSEGVQDNDVHGKSARWLTYKGPVADGSSALTIFDHPSNPRSPTKWFIVKRMPYFSPAFVFDGPMDLKKDQKLSLFYRMKVHPAAPDAESLDDDYDTFAKIKPKVVSTPMAEVPRIDLVAAGANLHKVYCATCHSALPEGEAGKAGPRWHGLIGKSPRQRKVFVKPTGEETINVDDAYIETSILQPNLHLAIRETEPQLGTPYAPSMPPYPHLTAQQRRSLIAFMKTLNVAEHSGPKEVWEVEEAAPVIPAGRFEVVVKDRPLIYRVAMADLPSRCVIVGLPGGYNYIFDPSTFVVRRTWAGGFLNVEAERTKRNKGYNRYGSGARSLSLAECLVPLGESGPINLEFKDYLNNNAWRLAKSKEEMQHKIAFIDRPIQDGAQFRGYRFDGVQAPNFLYRINNVDYEQQVAFESDGVMHYYFKTTGAARPLQFKIARDKLDEVENSAGTWDGDILSIPAKDAAEFFITLKLSATSTQVAATPNFNLSELGKYHFKDRLAGQLKKLALDKRTNYALGAKATSTGRADGDAIGPHGAVDGYSDSYWDETNGQKTYLLNLTLAKPSTINAVSILGWNHHDYAPRNFELIINGKTVKTVTDAVYDQNLLLIGIPRVECRTLQLRVTASYGESPAVRELSLYDMEQTPIVKKWTFKELATDADLTSQRTAPANIQRGMAAFYKASCIKCHPVGGKGANTGPDLSKVSTKYKGRKLLQQIIDPSSEVNKDFLTWRIVTNDGKVLSGLIVAEDAKTVSLVPKPDEPSNIISVAKSNIDERSPSKVSSMPLDALSILTRQEILDLLAYLESGGTAASE